MAEILIYFEPTLPGPGGRIYRARACGRQMPDDHRWEGWIEFEPEGSGPVIRTPRETVQPDREKLRYWATGLTAAYLEGALDRALKPPVAVPVRSVPSHPTYDGPAPSTVHVSAESGTRLPVRPVLDPFRVFAQGESVLRQELLALEPDHLRNIIRAYDFGIKEDLDHQTLSRGALAEVIVAAVRKRTGV